MATEADFVIIGGGTAGLVVAARLSENPNVQVTVLEAGEDQLQNSAISIPALWPSLLGSDLDWNFSSSPQAVLGGRRLGYPLGRLLGGSSGLNTHAYVPTTEVDLNTWQELGNVGWTWESIAPYYKKTHSLKLPSKDASEYLGLNYLKAAEDADAKGPIQCSFSGSTSDAIGQAWINAFKSLGYAATDDLWEGTALGGYAHATTVNPANKQRSYSASDYYAPVSSRENLHVVTSCNVRKILLENKGQIKATGVLAAKAGETKILELSGIGNPAILKANGIDIVIDNPHVGENFQDHPSTGLSFEVRDGIDTLDALNRQDPAAIQAAMQEYQSYKTGPLSTAAVNYSAVLPVMDFVGGQAGGDRDETLSKCLAPTGLPQSLYLPQQVVNFVKRVYSSDNLGSIHYFTYAAQGSFGADSGEAKNVAAPSMPGNFVTVAGFLCYPLSRGSVHIRSSDPSDNPAIDTKLLEHPLDLEMHSRHIRFIHEIVKTKPFASILKPSGRVVPAFADLTGEGDLEKTKAYLRRTAFSAWHPCGTCAMRPREQGGVLDASLRVYGADNVRVVDASMMPLICRGNLQATVYAVAEKAADIIKERWGLK